MCKRARTTPLSCVLTHSSMPPASTTQHSLPVSFRSSICPLRHSPMARLCCSLPLLAIHAAPMRARIIRQLFRLSRLVSLLLRSLRGPPRCLRSFLFFWPERQALRDWSPALHQVPAMITSTMIAPGHSRHFGGHALTRETSTVRYESQFRPRFIMSSLHAKVAALLRSVPLESSNSSIAPLQWMLASTLVGLSCLVPPMSWSSSLHVCAVSHVAMPPISELLLTDTSIAPT